MGRVVRGPEAASNNIWVELLQVFAQPYLPLNLNLQVQTKPVLENGFQGCPPWYSTHDNSAKKQQSQ